MAPARASSRRARSNESVSSLPTPSRSLLRDPMNASIAFSRFLEQGPVSAGEYAAACCCPLRLIKLVMWPAAPQDLKTAHSADADRGKASAGRTCAGAARLKALRRSASRRSPSCRARSAQRLGSERRSAQWTCRDCELAAELGEVEARSWRPRCRESKAARMQRAAEAARRRRAAWLLALRRAQVCGSPAPHAASWEQLGAQAERRSLGRAACCQRGTVRPRLRHCGSFDPAVKAIAQFFVCNQRVAVAASALLCLCGAASAVGVCLGWGK